MPSESKYARERALAMAKLKPFDVEIGDVVRHKMPKGGDGILHDPKFGSFGNPSYNRWTVTNISTHVFVGKNKYGIRIAFKKTDYQRGEVERIDKKPVASEMDADRARMGHEQA